MIALAMATAWSSDAAADGLCRFIDVGITVEANHGFIGLEAEVNHCHVGKVIFAVGRQRQSRARCRWRGLTLSEMM